MQGPNASDTAVNVKAPLCMSASSTANALAAVLLVGQPRAISTFPQRLRFHRVLADLGRVGGRARVDLFAVLEPQPGCDEMRTRRDMAKFVRAADTLEDPKWRARHSLIVGRRTPHINSTIHYLTAAEAAEALEASPHSYFHQFYKVAVAFRLAERAEQARGGERYRLLLRTRTDLIFTWPPPRLADESHGPPGRLTSLERSVRDWQVASTAAWVVHDWAWLAGRDAAEVLAATWHQMQQLGLLHDGDGEARWRALGALDWPRVLRSAWALRSSNFLLCAPYPASHLRQFPAGKGKSMLWRSLGSNASKVLAFWGALPAAIAAANANASADHQSRQTSHLRDCWWHRRRAGASNGTTTPSSHAGASALLEPEVALGLALFHRSAPSRLELGEIPPSVVGFPAICPPGC